MWFGQLFFLIVIAYHNSTLVLIKKGGFVRVGKESAGRSDSRGRLQFNRILAMRYQYSLKRIKMSGVRGRKGVVAVVPVLSAGV